MPTLHLLYDPDIHHHTIKSQIDYIYLQSSILHEYGTPKVTRMHLLLCSLIELLYNELHLMNILLSSGIIVIIFYLIFNCIWS